MAKKTKIIKVKEKTAKKKAVKNSKSIKLRKSGKKARQMLKPKKRVVKKFKKKVVKKPVKKIIKKTIKKPVKKRARKIVRKPAKRKAKKQASKPRVFVGKDPLDQLFESQVKVKLLKFFFRNAEDVFEQKEIFKHLRSNVILLRQEMNKLEKTGIIKQKKAFLSFENKKGDIKKIQKTVFYLNPEIEFINELKNLILKSVISSKEDLLNDVKKIGAIKLFVLNGIFTNNNNSVADMLIVGSKINQRKLNNFIKDLEAEVGKELNCAVLTLKEFDYRYDMYDRFVRDLISDKGEILIQRVRLW
ncbi:hypothetical protein KKA23_00150 [Patescibacteria group bacterium]|nr:hypothetical protein [Patescibacteria group bacterium]